MPAITIPDFRQKSPSFLPIPFSIPSFIFLSSFITSSIHLVLDLPDLRLLSGLAFSIRLVISSSFINCIGPAYRDLLTLVTLVNFSSLYNLCIAFSKLHLYNGTNIFLKTFLCTQLVYYNPSVRSSKPAIHITQKIVSATYRSL